MILPLFSVLLGITFLVWSADRFLLASASVARRLNMPPLLIGMVVVGFGTSAPELSVSALAASSGHTEIALGNAYGSNIANIALILGLTALVRPLEIQSSVLRIELPVLAAATMLAAYQAWDGQLTRYEALVLLAAFAGFLAWSIQRGLRNRNDALTTDVERGLDCGTMSPARALFWILAGLLLLVASSRLLVWGAVETAGLLGVSDLVIGLTIVAVGSSLPELASTFAAVRRGEHDMAVGNVLGSNLFNTLLVVGIAVAIQPTAVPPEILYRDMAVMGALTLSLFLFCSGYRRAGQTRRLEGAALISVFGGYSAFLITGAVS